MRTGRRSAIPALIGTLVFASCGGAGPTEVGAPATFELVVPGTPLSATAGGRTIEIVAGRLRFERFGGRPGAVSGSVTVRVTDPGAVPVTQVNAGAGRATRQGDTVTVLFDTGASESFAVEGGGAMLRTVAASCGPNPCTSVLRINTYRRVPD